MRISSERAKLSKRFRDASVLDPNQLSHKEGLPCSVSRVSGGG
jgi:hypothetical protein